MENKSGKNNIDFTTRWKIILAAIPVIAYLITFAFEAGYLNSFCVPTYFITMQLNTILFATLGVALVILVNYAIILFAMTTMPAALASKKFLKYRKAFIPAAILFIFINVIFTVLNFPIKAQLSINIGMMIGFLLSLFTFERSKLGENKSLSDITMEYLKFKTNSLKILAVIILLFLMIGISYITGVGNSANQTNFLVLNTNPEMAVLRIYGDRLICVSFDRQTKKYDTKFMVLNMKEKDKWEFRAEVIGPLRSRE